VPIVTTPCLVLQTHRFGDTSKILRLMTRDFGPRSAMARGALRPRSRISGLLEPFSEGLVTLYLKANRDLHTLSGFELVRSRQDLGRDMERFAGASVLAELVLRLAPEQRDVTLFEVLRDGLDALVEAPAGSVAAVAAARIWQLVAVLGFEPSLDACVSCGRVVPDREGARLDTDEGGVRCLRCPARGVALAPAELAVLRALVRGEVAPAVGSRQLGLLRDFIRVHVAEGARLRSLDFLGVPED
jgi:DNA repair protein RecO (recombination protein O)